VADAELFNDEDPWLCSFAAVEVRRPFLEEGSKRLTSVRGAHSFAKLHHFVLWPVQHGVELDGAEVI
jgi:hypothetical protein